MPAAQKPKQIKVHADGCSPDTLELIKGQDQVVFIQGGAGAPSTVQVDKKDLFGTTTCSVAATPASATVYAAKAEGNFVISLASNQGGTLQVICLAPSKALGVTGTGSIKVNG